MTEFKPEAKHRLTTRASNSFSDSHSGINRRLLLQAGAVVGAIGPACLNATIILPFPVPETLEQKVERLDGFILIGTFTGVAKSVPQPPFFTKGVRQPDAIAAYNKFAETSPRTQEAFEAYKRAYPADPKLFVFQEKEKLGRDRYDFIEFRLEKVAFATVRRPGQHMNMDAQYIYFESSGAAHDIWGKDWKPFVGHRVIILSKGEGTLPAGIPAPFPLHHFGFSGYHPTDLLPLPMSDLPKITEIALRLKFSQPIKKK